MLDFIALAHCMGRYVHSLGHIILNPSHPVSYILVLYNLMENQKTPMNYFLFDITRVRIHDQLHSRQTF